jgi:hypothetical protein
VLKGWSEGLWGLFWMGRGCIDLSVGKDGRLLSDLEKKRRVDKDTFEGLAKAFHGWVATTWCLYDVGVLVREQ